jgi:NAD(P)-dependent dehydrogenase (short-subunit alcohol dehydrogenase family)
MRIKGERFFLKNKRYIVTGAASGIGKSTSLVLAELGASLLLIDINDSALNQTQKECGDLSKTLNLDLTNFSSIKDELILAAKDGGKFDGFVHCAGISYISPLKTTDKNAAMKVYDLNAYAALELSKAFINRNVYSGESGSIVFISSVYGQVGSSANVAYAMSKSAINGLTKSLAIELSSKHIRVNCIAPGFVNTQMMSNTNQTFENNRAALLETLHPLGLGNPEDVAYPIAFLLSNASKWMTGAILNVDGGFTAQ